jgi:endonuclease/exonuclease/phosphatase family metal-dependent hydrolase
VSPVGPVDRRPAAARTITVVSYNVRRCRGLDGRRDPDRIAGVLGELDADVIGLQEVDSEAGVERGLDQLEHIARKIGAAPVPGATLLHHEGRMGNGLLTRLPILSVVRHDLSVPGCEPRGALDVRLEDGRGAIRVMATHLGLRARERRVQLDQLFGLTTSPAVELEVLLGDMNEWRAARRALAAMLGRFGPTRPVRTFPAWWPLLPLDRIWVNPPERVVEVRAHASALARRASDHLPVRATVRLDP